MDTARTPSAADRSRLIITLLLANLGLSFAAIVIGLVGLALGWHNSEAIDLVRYDVWGSYSEITGERPPAHVAESLNPGE